MNRWIPLVVLLCIVLVVGPACRDSEPTGSQPSSANVKELVKGLQAKPAGMDARPYLAERLGNMGPAAKEALPALRKLTTDKDEKTREAAKAAISKIEGK